MKREKFYVKVIDKASNLEVSSYNFDDEQRAEVWQVWLEKKLSEEHFEVLLVSK